MALRIVPPSEPSHKEQVTARVKRMARPDCLIQCNRCGGRTIMNTVNGALIKNGRKQGGTVIEKDVCYHCHLKGIYSPMLPELKRIE